MTTSRISSRLLALALASGLMCSAHALTVTKNAGATTPVLSDFSAVFANHPTKIGYGPSKSNGMFLETFRTQCPAGSKVSAANFSITVQRGQGDSGNDGLAFWDNQVAAFSTHIWGNEPQNATKTLSYNLASLPAVGAPVLANNGMGLGLVGDGDFSFSVQDDTSVLSATLEYSCEGPPKKGLTFVIQSQNAVTGMATAACQLAGQPDCNPYQGDQMCTAALPVLCMNRLNLKNPTGNPEPQRWSGAVIATTPDVAPSAANLTTKAQVDAYCVAQFGPNWTVADFHAGGGWKFGAYGAYGDEKKRAWVNIKDQPNGNCWTQ
jgi:hypothetical protein